jgi:hypothetical protein
MTNYIVLNIEGGMGSWEEAKDILKSILEKGDPSEVKFKKPQVITTKKVELPEHAKKILKQIKEIVGTEEKVTAQPTATLQSD